LVEEKEKLRINVIDNGYGIAEEDIDRVFEKFYRANSPDIKRESGSGLGLAFVKDAVEAQGGSISVKSAIEKGSTFSLTFPKVL
jgi:two-component system sensor histidine kinase SenX3